MNSVRTLGTLTALLTLTVALSPATFAQGRDPAQFPELSRSISADMEARAFAEEFKGLTTDGNIIEGLFPIEGTSVDTTPLIATTNAFIATLSEEEKQTTLYPADALEWRRWANMSIYKREGMSFDAMSEAQKAAAWNMLDAALSAKGMTLSRDIMRLNETLGELNNNNFVEFGEGKYWITVMGTPSPTEPWGWQLDGHHLVINFFVLGNQIVMTPSFWGSEPAVATSGKYAGTRIMDAEMAKGLELVRSLDAAQRAAAIISSEKTGNNLTTEAWSDNVVLENAGIEVANFTPEQKAALIDLIGLYIGNMEDPLAEVEMAEITKYLDQTWFAWIGGTDDSSVYYYRIQSPVLVIEFDHQAPVGLTHLYPRGVPYREHIHSTVRTPNGNDYGKDLLRQHLAAHPH
ncbi:MAG: hypothetical protein RLZZ227_1252 [Pseudomonadota bacterium]|jgi:hypothetical protein